MSSQSKSCEIFINSILEMSDKQKVASILESQRFVMERYEKSNEMLFHINSILVQRLSHFQNDISSFTENILDLKQQLSIIFKRIRRSFTHPMLKPEDSQCYIVRKGFLTKYKSLTKRFVVLYRGEDSLMSGAMSGARLKFFNSQSIWENGVESGKCVYLQDVLNIDRKMDDPNAAFALSIFLESECLSFIAKSQDELDAWLRDIWNVDAKNRALTNGANLGETIKFCMPKYEFVCDVKVLSIGICRKILCLPGSFRIFLHTHHMFFQRLSQAQSKYNEFAIEILSVKRCGYLKNTFMLQLGGTSLFGSGELYFKTEFNKTSSLLHDHVFKVVRRIHIHPSPSLRCFPWKTSINSNINSLTDVSSFPTSPLNKPQANTTPYKSYLEKCFTIWLSLVKKSTTKASAKQEPIQRPCRLLFADLENGIDSSDVSSLASSREHPKSSFSSYSSNPSSSSRLNFLASTSHHNNIDAPCVFQNALKDTTSTCDEDYESFCLKDVVSSDANPESNANTDYYVERDNFTYDISSPSDSEYTPLYQHSSLLSCSYVDMKNSNSKIESKICESLQKFSDNNNNHRASLHPEIDSYIKMCSILDELSPVKSINLSNQASPNPKKYSMHKEKSFILPSPVKSSINIAKIKSK